MSFKKVVVAGGGVLGSQIAFQAAYCGFDVTIWLRSEGSIGRAQPKIDKLLDTYRDEIEGMAAGTATWCAGIADSDAPLDKAACLARVQAAYEGLKLELDMAAAVADADLVIESMAEDPKAKVEFYQKMAPLLPAKTVIATNSSTLLPSQFAKYTGRPKKYLSLHFAAAGCVLPLSNNLDLGKDMGTRHRACLGIAENSDAIAIVVSEETGIISMALIKSGDNFANPSIVL